MNAAWDRLQQKLAAFWGERSTRERKQILLAAGVVICGLVYMILIEPAVVGRAKLEKSLPALRVQAVALQSLSKEAAALSAITATPVATMTKELLEATLLNKGLQTQNVTMANEIATVQLSGASFAGLLDWLDEMQKNARVTVVEAKIVAQAQSDIVNATLTLRQ